MILRSFISLRAFAVYMENSMRFEISLRSNWPKWNLHQSHVIKVTAHKVMWTLIMKLPHTEVKFYSEVKSQTGLSSLRISCKRALRSIRPEVFCKKRCSEKIRNVHRKTPVLESLFNKIADLRPEDCFHVNFAKFFIKPIFEDERLWWLLLNV